LGAEMKHILYIGCLLFYLPCVGQTTFFQEINSVPYFPIQSCISTYDSGYALLTNYGNLLKMDKNGDSLWSKQFDISPNYPQRVFMMQTHDGGLIILEETSYISYGRMLIRTDKNGDTLWTRHYPQGLLSILTQQIAETSDGSFIFTYQAGGGYTASFSKIDSAGNPVWGMNYEFVGYGNGMAITELSDGNYLLLGEWDNGHIFLLKTDTAGIPIWYKFYEYPLSSIAAIGAKENSEGEIVIFGIVTLPGHNMGSTILIVTDSVGAVEWSRYYSGNLGSYIRSFFEADDGGYYICGRINDSNLNNVSNGIIKLNDLGSVEWSSIIGDTGIFYYPFFEQTIDGGLISYTGQQNHSYISKSDTLGNNNCNTTPFSFQILSDTITVDTVPRFLTTFSFQLNYLNLPVTIHQAHFDITKCINDYTEDFDFSSLKIFPNPAVIEFKIENENSNIQSVIIIDLCGRMMYSAVGINNKGWTVDCRNFQSGIYFISVQLANGSVTRKLIID
jgi:hypothetical protein